jgi:hypothetical protein
VKAQNSERSKASSAKRGGGRESFRGLETCNLVTTTKELSIEVLRIGRGK